jgi:hypothetical protein
MIFDIFDALKSRRASISILQKEVERLQALKKSSLESIDPRYNNGSFVLKVSLHPSERNIVFFVGQKLLTPMGPGELVAIIPGLRSLHIKLPVFHNSPKILPINFRFVTYFSIMFLVRAYVHQYHDCPFMGYC